MMLELSGAGSWRTWGTGLKQLYRTLELGSLCCWELQSQAFSSVALRQSPVRPSVP